ncbi:4'-phosphopantetheinyl transferase NpgA [Cladobotryum mycophilum]|uniref:holo-[acyl-carrier-protein] synthase n=1 Tax=Cladobotryum mycophilum TaxID=491253 RepID=A0ABR0SFX3_9HYPO
MTPPTVIQWALDTRNLWPEAKETKELSHVASRAMSLLSPSEQSAVLRYYFVKDAKLSLGSSLLKRLAICRFCRVPWADATSTRDERTKPVFLMPADGSEPLLFNISHQAGVVVLFAVHLPPPGLAIGVDIVCVGERRERDHQIIKQEGWAHFLAIHDEVLCPREVQRLRYLPIKDVDKLLEYFYALWCLREAYVKMTGEALLAAWLPELEMKYYSPPGEAPPEGADKYLEVWFKGAKVTDVEVKLERELDDEYMISTVTRKGTDGRGVEVGKFEVLDLESLLDEAEELKATF